MKVNWEKKEDHQGVLTVEVEEAKVNAALDTAFKKVRKDVTIPGFRKGKIPRKLFEARFGVEALYQDAVDLLLPESYAQAIEKAGIEPVVQPEIDVEQIEKDQPFIFKATVTVKPEVELGPYMNLEIPEKDFSVKEEDIDNELERMRERVAELEVIDEKAQEKDYVIIDFEGSIDGEKFEGGEAENYSLELGSGQFIPGFEDQLIGCKAGENKEVVVTFPEDYHQKSLAGKEATFKVSIKEVKRKNLPELDDEFAKDISEFDTLEELKADVKKKLEEEKAREAEQYKQDTVVDQATENATVDIPEVMVEQEVDQLLEHYEHQLKMQGLNLAQYLQLTDQDEDTLREQYKEVAEKRVKRGLVLEAIAKKENIEVSEEDVEAELKKLADLTRQDIESVKVAFEEKVKDDLLIQKAIELLVSNSQNAA